MFSNTTLNRLFNSLPRREINKIISAKAGDRYRKTYFTSSHLHLMLISQLSSCESLRDLELILNRQKNTLYHLGLGTVKRSTISDANRKMDASIFKDIASVLLQRLQGEKKELQKVVTALDSSIIRAEGRGHQWSVGSRAGSKGLKLHVQFDQSNDQIEYIQITDATVNDISVAQTLSLSQDRIYVFDKGYLDYNWWSDIKNINSTFVTRLKKNSAYTIVSERPLQPQEKGFILKDQLIELRHKSPRGGKTNTLAGCPLRLIHIRHPDPKRKDPLILVSNECESAASLIAGWYKKRWSVELVFKWLKQNLKVKSFLGESRNGILIQLFIAIIAYVLLKLYKSDSEKNTTHLRLKDISVLAKNTLFVREKLERHYREKEQRRHEKQPSLFPFNISSQAT